jgi:uncharacterized membrane protein YfcA
MSELATLTPTLIALCALITLLAGLGHGTLGLGFSVIATASMALFLDMRSAILISLLPTVVVNILSILRGGHWSESIAKYWPLAAYAALGGVAGTQLLLSVDPAPFKLLLALIIVLYLNIDRFGTRHLAVVHRYRRSSMALVGLLAGMLAGTVNVMVPLLIIYALELGLAATAMVQVFNLCFLAGKLSQAATFSAAGHLGMAQLVPLLPLAASAALGVLLGMKLRERIEETYYRALLKKVLFLIAVTLVVQFLWAAI